MCIEFKPGDVCVYAFENGGEPGNHVNKSKAIVEVVKILGDPRGVAEIKFHEVIVDDTGNGLFEYLHRTGKTMNASFQYLQKDKFCSDAERKPTGEGDLE